MKPEVALVNMPFYGVDCPSLGLSLLKAALSKRDIPCSVHYPNIWFAKHIGFDVYTNIFYSFPDTDLIGERIFASALWGCDPARDRIFEEEVLESASRTHRSKENIPGPSANPNPTPISPLMAQKILQCRDHVSSFLSHCLTSVDWNQYRIVGFSSMFQQQLASLALASRLKEQYPHLLIAFGGANCEGRMGAALLEAFPFIDVVCSGEGDVVFPEFVEGVMRGEKSIHSSHLLRRQVSGKHSSLQLLNSEPRSPRVDDLDALPFPDFDDFFAERVNCSVEERCSLLIETSRGCWWGEIAHCTFCGLNGSSMTFRCKSAERVVQEIRWMLERYGEHTRYIAAADTIIPTEYFSSLLPALERLNLDLELYYEAKANLKKEHIALCGRVGLRHLTPGIESFITPVLQLMRKGSTCLQNIQTLKWCRQFGVFPCWYYLVGFPGEKPEHYAGQAELVDAICHLQPPFMGALVQVRFDRFSPYFMTPDDFKIRNLRPYPSYRYIYPRIQEKVLNDLAYFFVGEFDGKEMIAEYTASLGAAVGRWYANQPACALFSINLENKLVICDYRPSARTFIHALAGTEKIIYEECDSICTKARLLKRLNDELGEIVDEIDIDAILQSLIKEKLIVHEDGKYLALAVPLGHAYIPSKEALDNLSGILEQELAIRSSGEGDHHNSDSHLINTAPITRVLEKQG